MRDYRYSEFVPKLAALADVPFEAPAFRSTCESFGWKVGPLPDWCDFDDENNVGICCRSEILPTPFMAVFVGEQMAGLVLYALVDANEEESPGCLTTREGFDAAYHDACSGVISVLGAPTEKGPYVGYRSAVFHYAVWQRSHSWLMVVEHEEGDANFGHEATIDIRMMPRRNAPVFPLTTNVIF